MNGTEIDRYVEALLAKGMPEREAARAAFYAKRYGLDALRGEGDDCVVFKQPSCGDWNCLNPEHQVLASEQRERADD